MTELVAFVKDPLDFMLDGGIIVNRVHRAFSHRSINPVQRVSAATAFSAGAVKEKIELMGFVGHEGSSIQEPTRTSYASWAIDGLCMRAAQGRQPPTYQLKVAAE